MLVLRVGLTIPWRIAAPGSPVCHIPRRQSNAVIAETSNYRNLRCWYPLRKSAFIARLARSARAARPDLVSGACVS